MSTKARSPHTAFERLAAAHATSAAGDTLVAIALAGTLFFDVPTAEARTRVAVYLLLTMTPFALLAPLVGPLMDRWFGAHRLAIVISATGRLGLALFMTSTADSLLLYPAAFGVLVFSRAHSVARTALVPAVVGPDTGLVAANARLARVALIGGAVAAGPGILLNRVGGVGPTLLFAAIVFLTTIVAGLALPRPRRHARSGDDASRPLIIPTRVRRALIVNYVIRATGGFLLMLLAFSLRRLGVGPLGFGFVLAASGLGSFVGASVVPRLRRGGNEEWVLVIALIVGTGAAVIASGDFGTDFAALVGAAVGMLSNAGRLALDSVAQQALPEAARGRAFSRFETGLQLFWVMGALLPVLVAIRIEIGLWMASAAFAAAAVWFLISLGAGGRRDLSS